MRISDWSSDVCSSDLPPVSIVNRYRAWDAAAVLHLKALHVIFCYRFRGGMIREIQIKVIDLRSEEHTSELQSLMRISYAVFCLKKKKTKRTHQKAYSTNASKTQHTKSTKQH